MRTARDHACRFTGISSKFACAGNDGGEHDDVCDLITKSTVARDAEFSPLVEAVALAARMPCENADEPEFLPCINCVSCCARRALATTGSVTK